MLAMPKKKILPRLLLATVVPALLLGLLELGLRLSPWGAELGPDRIVGNLHSHTLFWNPGHNMLTSTGINTWGYKEFRGQRVAPKKPPGVFRVIALGGSSTWGYPYDKDPDAAYPRKLEHVLRSHARAHPGYPHYEVINAGVGGFSSYQGLLYLKLRLLRLKPDLVLVNFGNNDAQDNTETGVVISDKAYYDRQRELVRTPGLLAARQTLSNLRVFNLLGRLVFQLKVVTSEAAPRVPPEQFRDNYLELIRLSRAHGFKLVLIDEAGIHLATGRMPPAREIAANRYYQITRKLAAEHPGQARVCDMVTLLSRHAGHQRELFHDMGHLTHKGNDLLVGQLFDVLLESGFLR